MTRTKKPHIRYIKVYLKEVDMPKIRIVQNGEVVFEETFNSPDEAAIAGADIAHKIASQTFCALAREGTIHIIGRSYGPIKVETDGIPHQAVERALQGKIDAVSCVLKQCVKDAMDELKTDAIMLSKLAKHIADNMPESTILPPPRLMPDKIWEIFEPGETYMGEYTYVAGVIETGGRPVKGIRRMRAFG